MMRYFRISALFVGLFAVAAFVGCEKGADVEDTAAQSAEEAVGLSGDDGTERTVSQQEDVLVKDTTEVIDRDTGEVIKTEETVTPVTVQKEKTVETDVDVDTGETTTTVE